jgi:hypothetical protein
MMADEILSLYRWRVKPGNEQVFTEAWLAYQDYLVQAPYGTGEHVLVQSTDDTQRFDSFGPWPSASSLHAMRADPQARQMMQGLSDLCEEATPGTFQVVARTRHAVADNDKVRHLRRAS